MAKFLQETIAETGVPGSDDARAAKEFSDFFRKVRAVGQVPSLCVAFPDSICWQIRITGEQATTDDILKIAKRFEDELTLDNLSRPQLVSMCRYMSINAFGTDNFLRYQIRNRMTKIKADDRVIQNEGIDSLTIQELSNACAARGIRTIGTSPARLRDELAQWLDLHLDHQVPSTLLILSRAFSFTDRGLSTQEALQATLSSLPDNLVNEAELQVLESEGATTYKQKLEVLEQQQELIEDESEQEEKEAQARREAKEAEEAQQKLIAEQEAQQKAELGDKLLTDAQVLYTHRFAAVTSIYVKGDRAPSLMPIISFFFIRLLKRNKTSRMFVCLKSSFRNFEMPLQFSASRLVSWRSASNWMRLRKITKITKR